MYCRPCRQLLHEDERRPREGGAGADRFGNLQCQRCGVPLPGGAEDGSLGTKMEQLARFGLADPDPRGSARRAPEGRE